MFQYQTTINCDAEKCDQQMHFWCLVDKKHIKRVKGWFVRRDGKTFCPTCKAAKKHLPTCCFCGTMKDLCFACDPLGYDHNDPKDFMCVDCHNARNDEV